MLRREWLVETPGHTYDVKIKNDLVYVLSENELKVFPIADPTDVIMSYTHVAGLYCLLFGKDFLLLGAEDKKALLLKDGEISAVELEYGVYSCAGFAGGVVLGACCGDVYFLDIKTLDVKKVFETNGHVYSLDADDVVVVSSFDGFVYLLDENFKLKRKQKLAENVNVVSIKDDMIVAGTFEPGGFFVMDKDLNLLWSRGGYFDVRFVAWRDSRSFYVGSWDGVVSLYRTDGTELIRGKGPRGIECGYWKDGMLAVGAWGRLELYKETEEVYEIVNSKGSDE